MTKKIDGLGGLPQSNMFSNVPDFTAIVHVRENTQANEDHLNDNRQKFTGQCAIVLSLLQNGHVLSSFSAMTIWHIGHLARRIKDIKDAAAADPNLNIVIEDQYEYDKSGKVTRNKIWFMRDRISEHTAIKHKISWEKK